MTDSENEVQLYRMSSINVNCCVAVRRTGGRKARRWRRVRSAARIRVDERRRATADREVRRQASLSAHRHPRSHGDANTNALSRGTLPDNIRDRVGSYCRRSDRVELSSLRLARVTSVQVSKVTSCTRLSQPCGHFETTSATETPL